MWVYRTVDVNHPPHSGGQVYQMYEVGYFISPGTMMVVEKYNDRERAANRVHFLNGGDLVSEFEEL